MRNRVVVTFPQPDVRPDERKRDLVFGLWKPASQPGRVTNTSGLIAPVKQDQKKP